MKWSVRKLEKENIIEAVIEGRTLYPHFFITHSVKTPARKICKISKNSSALKDNIPPL